MTLSASLVCLALFVVVILALIIGGNKTASHETESRESYFRSGTWRFLQTVLIGVGLLSFVWRSLLRGEGPDAVAASFLVLVLLVAVIPWVSKIVFPGEAEVDFLSKEAKNDVLALDQNAEIAQLTMALAAQFVSDLQATLALTMRNQTQPAATRRDAVNRILSIAAESMAILLRPLPPSPDIDQKSATTTATPERLRISAWMSANNRTSLGFFHGWPVDSAQHLAKAAIQIIGTPSGKVFGDGQTLNYQILAEDQRPPPEAEGRSYNGILIVPIHADGRSVGVLQIEREKADRFGPPQVAIARALAALYATTT